VVLVLVVISILLYCWAVFVFCVCLPLFQSDYHWAWPVTYLVIFHVLLCLVLWSYFRAIFTTSYVPRSFKHATEEEVNHEDSELIQKPNSKKRYCGKCEQDKPDRAHHCSRCQRCVLKMDHHCPWINNCVGWNNYKYFNLFTCYTLLLCIVGVLMIVPVMILTWDWNVYVFSLSFLPPLA